MNVSTASALIGRYVAEGRIDHATAARAQDEIRRVEYYGNRMTGADRRRLLSLRFGIVDAPQASALQRPYAPATFEGVDADGFARYSNVVLG